MNLLVFFALALLQSESSSAELSRVDTAYVTCTVEPCSALEGALANVEYDLFHADTWLCTDTSATRAARERVLASLARELDNLDNAATALLGRRRVFIHRLSGGCRHFELRAFNHLLDDARRELRQARQMIAQGRTD